MITIIRKSIFISAFVALTGCWSDVSPFSVAEINKVVSGDSKYPTAVNIESVGVYPGKTKSGAGYFYDEVLEYRVWVHPEKGAEDRANGQDYFYAFAEYEEALKFSDKTEGAEPPLVLIRQLEWVNEPSPGTFIHEKGERVTEWRVEWLLGSKRNENSINNFLKNNGKKA